MSRSGNGPLVLSSLLWNLVHPLCENNENAFNSLFLRAWLVIFCVSCLIVTILQLLSLLQNSSRHGSYALKHANTQHKLRMSILLAHVSIVSWIASHLRGYSKLTYTSLMMLLLTLIGPLHAVEPLYSPRASDCLIVAWLALSFFYAVFLFQNSYTLHPIANHGLALDSFLCLSSIYLSLSETYFYKPNYDLILDLTRTDRLDEMLKPNIIARVSYTWMNDMIVKTHLHKTIAGSDLPDTPESISSRELTRKFEQYLQDPHTTSLWWPLAQTFGGLTARAFVYDLFYAMLSYVQPQLLRHLILFFGLQHSNGGEDGAVPLPILYGLLIAISMFVVTILQTLVYNQYFLYNLHLFLGARLVLHTVLYRKLLHLSPEAAASTCAGDIINLMSVDINRLELVPDELLEIVIAPISILVCIGSLLPLLGTRATAAGVAVMLVFIPINGWLVRMTKRLRKTQMKFKDKRTRMISQILTSIRSIKLFAWERSVLADLDHARNNLELKNLRRIKTFSQFAGFLWGSVPFMVSLVCFAVFVSTQKTPLTSDIVFPALSLFGLLSTPLTSFPSALTSLADASVLFSRLYKFLKLGELDQTHILRRAVSADSGRALHLEKATFMIPSSEDDQHPKPVIQDLDLTVNKGELACLVGRVGSGKSSLFNGLLGKLDFRHDRTGARAIIYGLVAYCSQLPWVMNATVKENIVFGHRFDSSFYLETVAACQLEPDLRILPNGDDTLVGERGVTLSGGQKARLALARAVYARADVYLLDDVLSAVDAHVGKRLVDKVLGKAGLLSLKTVLMSTNSLSILHQADRVLLMQNGQITESCPLSEATAVDHPGIHDLITNYMSAEDSASDDQVAESPTILAEAQPLMRKASVATFDYSPIMNIGSKTTERSKRGKVTWLVYSNYARACSLVGVAIWFVILVASSTFIVAGNYWLKHWTERNALEGTNVDPKYFITVYSAIGFAAIILNVLRGLLLLLWLAFNASKKIHNEMAKLVVASPMWFFDSTPMGTIMNRFTNDVNKVDESIPAVFLVFFSVSFKTLFKFIVIVHAIPWYILVLALLLVIYVYYEIYYVSASRELKRLVSVAKLPIYAHLSESINGADTIRAFSHTQRFESINEANISFSIKCVYMLRSIGRWINFRLQCLGSLGVLGASLLCIFTVLPTSTKPMTASMAGFIMVYSLEVTSALRTLVKFTAQVETNAVAVERCMEYQQLKGEQDDTATNLFLPPLQWPQKGQVAFANYLARYKPGSELVLKDISINIESHEKIGVVGRTGAGKSSLALAIFRLVDEAKGHISIDGIDTSAISLYDLRSRIAIIPQDSQLIEGTIRLNLDPYKRYSDEDLWRVLTLSHLKLHITLLNPDGDQLECKVMESGSNFLLGQRQLMSLARVLLRMNDCQVLVLDEATALVDVQTDRLIQSTIRREFSHKTIITIAHRLETVGDSDKICVLDAGCVKEFDTPQNLLADKSSLYYSLCKS